jgi:hypothetical protein
MMLSLIGYLQSRMIRKKWERKGKPLPTPERIKQDIVKDYAKSFSLRTFIETGTYHGGMVHAVKRCFERIWSIELDKNLCEEARQRFRRDHHISIVQGDSGEVLPEILASVDTPSLFWLDGHYSGGDTAKGKLETPIRIELQHIFAHRVAGHVILIDDVHCFNGTGDYPSLGELQNIILTARPSWVFEARDNIIRCHEKCTE